jgi:hypothetical protein
VVVIVVVAHVRHLMRTSLYDGSRFCHRMPGH